MAPRSIFFIFPFFLFFQFSRAARAGRETESVPATKISGADCLSAFNDARSAAGLAAFKEKSTTGGDSAEALCARVQEGAGGYHAAGTYFYAHQTGEEEDCAAAVSYWRGGLVVVNNQLPPAYTNSTDVYKNEQFLGLVGLYNPKANAGVECKYVTCPVPTTTPTRTTSPSTTSSGTNVKAAVPESEQPTETESQMIVPPATGDETAEGTGERADAAASPEPDERAAPGAGAASTEEQKEEGKGGDLAGVAQATPGQSDASSAAASSPEPAEGAAPGAGAASTEEQKEGKGGDAAGVAQATPGQSDAPAPVPEGEGKRRRLSVADTYNVLICKTTPPVLVENEQPFNQGQWDKIVGSISASPTAAVPPFSLLALTALAIYVF